jgi:subtilisin-like proprotein convertase family protein
MPPLASVVAGNLAPTWEVVSTAGRTYNFALTVRDNRAPNGGQTSRDNVLITASTTIGPFTVTSQNSLETWVQGESRTIAWNRNGAQALVGSTNVDILLSTDGGLTFPIALTPTGGVANSGTATVTVPNIVSLNCRLMVRPTGNIYYAVNSAKFYIGYTVTNNCNTYTYNTPFTVTDNSNSYTLKTLNVPTNVVITDVNVNVNATHANIQDLFIAVARPGSTTLYTLINQSCFGNANMNVTFDSQGTALTCASPTQGTYLPVSSLNPINGFNSAGNWTLGFKDLVAGNVGTINSFSIEICSQTIALASDNFSFDNFGLYPNPNDGSFNVTFNSNTNNAINISVYDMRGREIFNRAYQNTGLFEQNIQLDSVQSGIYLVNIQDGDKKIVKKIVVQ